METSTHHYSEISGTRPGAQADRPAQAQSEARSTTESGWTEVGKEETEPMGAEYETEERAMTLYRSASEKKLPREEGCENGVRVMIS